jgi:hypothetical protein
MRRITMLLTVALVMAAMMLVSAFPALAAANRHASCMGAGHSNQTEPGAAGDWHSRGGSSGQGDIAKSYARLVSPGPDRNTSGYIAPDEQSCSYPG